MTASTLNDVTLEDLTGDYVLDTAHSRIGFVARQALVAKVRGQFNAFKGKAHLDFENPSQSSAQVTVDVASVDTRNTRRDGHLRTDDFFDAASFPQITFLSTAVERLDELTYRLTGDLTVMGVTKPVTVQVEYTGAAKDPFGHTSVGFEGGAAINRRGWGVEWHAPLGVLVSEKVDLEFVISAVKVA